MIVPFSQVSPPPIWQVMPRSLLACSMISGAVVILDGANINSGLAFFILVSIALKSCAFVWNLSFATTSIPSASHALSK